ncbi:MAG: class I SAM-dependent methyltransferase [Candidatus Omnitrophota bacterium]|nr:class I SAM-dependent methyltransferase [Candidatus Omnitrophota bacterium]
MDRWYRNWQHPAHAVQFDGRAHLDLRNLIRNYEAFNDVRLLNERVERSRAFELLEVGCATGEFIRYLRAKFPLVHYIGLDVSEPAIARAKAKYPEVPFFVVQADSNLTETLRDLGVTRQPDTVYSKDVVQHQVRPFEFLSSLIEVASEAVILRCRTRDVGTTVLDPERSCQFYEGDWLPYIVLNLQELVEWVRAKVPEGEIVLYRHHMVLGGQHGRFLPKELYRKETGTAETAVGIFKQTERPGTVMIYDQPEQNSTGTWDYRMRSAVRKAMKVLRSSP